MTVESKVPVPSVVNDGERRWTRCGTLHGHLIVVVQRATVPGRFP